MSKKSKLFVKRALVVSLATAIALASSACSKKTSQEKHVGSGEMPETLTVFAPISGNAAKAGAVDRNDILMYQIAEEKTGCHVEWISPTQAAAVEQFNLMIASGEYPDIIQTGWRSIAGGAEQYVNDGVIVALSDYAEYMPNFTGYLEQHPNRKAEFVNEDGSYYFAPCIRNDDELLVYVGPTIRQDWLDKLGLKMPTNTDELYTVLKAFKTQDPNGNGKADEIPFTGMGGDSAAYGVGNVSEFFGTYYDFIVKDGKITLGMIQPEMKEALTYLNKLYKEGLIDPDYLTQDTDTYSSKIMNDRAGFTFGIQPSKYYDSMNDGTRLLSAVPYFDGKSYNIIYKMGLAGGETAITTACKNPEGAAKWLDFFYSQEGIDAFNYGIEGKTYDVVDGKKVLKMEYFEKNPDGHDRTEMFATTLGITNTDFAGVQLWDSYSQNLKPWGKEAIKVWTDSVNFNNIKPNLLLTPEEQEIVNGLLPDMYAYSGTLFNDIIVGNKKISELENAEKELNKLGLKEVTEIYNDAYARYLKANKE